MTPPGAVPPVRRDTCALAGTCHNPRALLAHPKSCRHLAPSLLGLGEHRRDTQPRDLETKPMTSHQAFLTQEALHDSLAP